MTELYYKIIYNETENYENFNLEYFCKFIKIKLQKFLKYYINNCDNQKEKIKISLYDNYEYTYDYLDIMILPNMKIIFIDGLETKDVILLNNLLKHDLVLVDIRKYVKLISFLPKTNLLCL